MKHDLIERYIYAVTKKLPYSMRSDVAKELRTLIDDMLEARCGDLVPQEKDLRVVLAELGTPSQLARQYDPQGDRCLIGPPYFSKYRFVLLLVLGAVALGSFVTLVITLLTQQPVWYEAVLSFFANLTSGWIMGIGGTTLVFAILQYKKIALDTDDSLSQLPPVPKKNERISRVECIIGILFSLFFLCLFLFFPSIIGAWVEGTGFIPLFNEEALRQLWPFLLLFTLLGIGREVYEMYEGRYTRRLALVAVVTDALSALLAVLLFHSNHLINQKFIHATVFINMGQDTPVNALFENFNLFFLGCILLALLIDAIVLVGKGLYYDRGKCNL